MEETVSQITQTCISKYDNNAQTEDKNQMIKTNTPSTNNEQIIKFIHFEHLFSPKSINI